MRDLSSYRILPRSIVYQVHRPLCTIVAGTGYLTTNLDQGFAASQVSGMVVIPGNGKDAFIAMALLIVLGVHLVECLAPCELHRQVSRIDHARSA